MADKTITITPQELEEIKIKAIKQVLLDLFRIYITTEQIKTVLE